MNPETTLIDVRTPEEFATERAPNSVNIPLHQLEIRLTEIKAMKNIILCCASGHRSGIAELILKKNNIDCRNGGSWFLHINK